MDDPQDCRHRGYGEGAGMDAYVAATLAAVAVAITAGGDRTTQSRCCAGRARFAVARQTDRAFVSITYC